MSRLFIDIETVPAYSEFRKVPDNLADLFISRFKSEVEKGELLEDIWNKKASLHAEFNKVVCISMGAITAKSESIKIKSLCGHDEKKIISDFADIALQISSMVAHNGIEFDFPVLMRKMIIHQVSVPPVLNTMDKKPWEVNLYDTMKMWSGTAWNYKVSLALLAETLGLPSPKVDIDGAKVGEIYWKSFESDGMEPDVEIAMEGIEHAKKLALEKIQRYCQGDVYTLINVYQLMKFLPVYSEEQIMYQL